MEHTLIKRLITIKYRWIMKKNVFFAAVALAALTSCADESFVGDEALRKANEQAGNAIVFSTGVNTVTRAEKTGIAAAALLNNEFVFVGTKSTSATSLVFDQYTAHWVANTANTTESNSSDWEYVNYKPATTSGLYDSGNGVQSIKYWDYSATQYDFAAYSLGTGVEVTPATDPKTYTYADASAIATENKSYTLTGSSDELKACYISDLVTAYNRDGISDYGQPVQFKFRSLASKVRLAFYETVPGYSVKDVQFYTAASPTALATDGTQNDPTLFTSSAVLPSGSGTMTVTFPTTGYDNRSDADYNKAHVAFAQASGVDAVSTIVLEDLDYLAAAEYKEATGNLYLGRASNAATFAGGLESGTGKYFTVLPYETGANLQLRIKYTLVSRDGSGEEITVDNATAVIPAELTRWKPNYAYTYIFKIGDMTNGSTGVDGSNNIVTGLTPITLDAVVVDSEDGVQETITTVSTPSITTYAQGKVVTENDEYKAGVPVYIIVNNGTSNVELTVNTNAKLFTATVESGAIQTISEASVNNAFVNGTYDSSAKTYTVSDAAGKHLVLTDTESTLLSSITEIAATDSPNGNAVTVNGAKFTPAAGTTYVFQYLVSAAVSASPAVYTQVSSGTSLTEGKTYYTSSYGDGAFVAGSSATANESTYELTTAATAATPAVYQYKVIKVVSSGS